MSEVEYNALIYEISEKIEETNLDFLKFMCRHHLGNGPWEHITTVRKLLLELEKKNRLGIDRLDLLKEIVKQLKKQKKTLLVLEKIDDFEVRRKAQSIGVISRLNRAADSLVGVVKLVCTWKTLGGVLLGSCGVLALSKCSTLTEVFEVFDKVILPTGVKLIGISEGSLCFTVQAEMESALNELWNFYKDGTLKNRLQEFLVTKEVKEFAGSDEVEVTVFIDEHEWKEAYVNMLFHQNQADAVKGEEVRERRRRDSDSFLFLTSKEIHMTKMKLEQSENKWNFERQLLQKENEKLQISNRQPMEGDDFSLQRSSQLEQQLTLEDSRRRKEEKATTLAEISPPSSSSKVDPIRSDPRHESPPSSSSKVDPIHSDPRHESWYFDSQTQSSAEELLKNQSPGTFLVGKNDDAKNSESYVISWRDTDGYQHQTITRSLNGAFVLKGHEDLRFSSLEASVLHFITGSTNGKAMVPVSRERAELERTTQSDSPLHSVLETGDTDAIETLSQGVDTDSRDMEGRTPLMIAAIHGRGNAFSLLLERGSDPALKDNSGRIVLHWAAQYGRNTIIQELLSHGSHGLDIDSRDNKGCTPLMEAAIFGKENTVSCLLERGSDPTLQDNSGQSALHWAARVGSKEIVGKLLSQGLDINSRTNSGETPLQVAEKFGQAEVVKYLVSWGTK